MGSDLERQTPVEVTAKVRCGDGQKKKKEEEASVTEEVMEEVWNRLALTLTQQL